MKYRLGLALCLFTFALCPRPAVAQASANPGFEKLKALAGEWDGKTQDGKAVHVSYKLVSNGTALMETLAPSEEAQMITMYHSDGTSVGMTHYCNENNQPQMRTAPVAGSVNQLAFHFVRATNLASPADGHMVGLVLVFEDNDHFTQKWTFRKAGKDMTEAVRFTRKS